VGPRDLAAGEATLVDRLAGPAGRSKQPVPLDGVASLVAERLERQHAALLAEATAARDARIAEVATVDEAIDAAATGWARLPWSAVGEGGEDRLAEHGVSV